MSFSWPDRQVFTTSRATTYSFIHIPARDSLPTLLFLHGFPSHIYDWVFQIQHFASKGYGTVALDLLGYGESSKPSDAEDYRLKSMSGDIMELLDSLRQSIVVGIGHDFGSLLLSRAATYHPERCSALVFLSVGPASMGTPFDVEAINRMTKEALGYELLGYIPWLGSDPGAQHALEMNSRSTMSLMFCSNPTVWTEWFRPINKMKEFVTEHRQVEIGSWYTSELQNRHLDAFGKEGGYKGATRWYQMWLNNMSLPDEAGLEDARIRQPALFICEKNDSQQRQILGSWAQHLSVIEFEVGHWIHLERASETNIQIEAFLEREVCTCGE